eukprot:TRINITY_DN15200_c0_g1::TRINITY_DN15200_c0_g1_i1::g.30722::m.30722 TRINITY_DN15200_c0_g1::TRINITY_DN15200_c0_g1_i1::g.30722  ORF type:complete len:168 (-),score=8.63,Acyl_CoA_thio/PF02551.10/0.14 TRINITY_DN15200_c0_g1_i1:430-933(-)
MYLALIWTLMMIVDIKQKIFTIPHGMVLNLNRMTMHHVILIRTLREIPAIALAPNSFQQTLVILANQIHTDQDVMNEMKALLNHSMIFESPMIPEKGRNLIVIAEQEVAIGVNVIYQEQNQIAIAAVEKTGISDNRKIGIEKERLNGRERKGKGWRGKGEIEWNEKE